jgi:hypothetical protein
MHDSGVEVLGETDLPDGMGDHGLGARPEMNAAGVRLSLPPEAYVPNETVSEDQDYQKS